MNKKQVIRFAKILLVIIVIYVWYRLRPYMDPYAIRTWVNSFGKLGPIFYVVAWTFLPVFLFPVIPLVIAGGMIFGLVKGLLLTLIGVFFNGSIMFFITRKFAKERVKKFLYPRLSENIKERLYLTNQKSLWIFFALLRFLPAISYNILNYTAGLTEMNYKSHISSTIVGVLPGAFMYINIGDKILEPSSKEFVYSLIFMLVLILISLLVAKLYMPEGKKNEGKGDDSSSHL